MPPGEVEGVSGLKVKRSRLAFPPGLSRLNLGCTTDPSCACPPLTLCNGTCTFPYLLHLTLTQGSACPGPHALPLVRVFSNSPGIVVHHWEATWPCDALPWGDFMRGLFSVVESPGGCQIGLVLSCGTLEFWKWPNADTAFDATFDCTGGVPTATFGVNDMLLFEGCKNAVRLEAVVTI